MFESLLARLTEAIAAGVTKGLIDAWREEERVYLERGSDADDSRADAARAFIQLHQARQNNTGSEYTPQDQPARSFAGGDETTRRHNAHDLDHG